MEVEDAKVATLLDKKNEIVQLIQASGLSVRFQEIALYAATGLPGAVPPIADASGEEIGSFKWVLYCSSLLAFGLTISKDIRMHIRERASSLSDPMAYAALVEKDFGRQESDFSQGNPLINCPAH